MAGRGRRIAVALVALALVLSAGRWTAVFLAERLWESSVSERVAEAGARLALQAAALEVLGVVLVVGWLLGNIAIAAQIALPLRPPPERPAARRWPAQIPRWWLAVAAIVLGFVLGSGAGSWRDAILLSLDGTRLGVPDPLLGADLGVFLSRVPLWAALQQKAALVVFAALVCVTLLHIAGETIRIVDRRLWVFPRARGQLGVLLGLLALLLSLGAGLERYRLAAGAHGPLLPSEFQLGVLIARVQMGLAALAGLFSFLWWHRMRGLVVVGLWCLYGVSLLGGRGLPLRTEARSPDPDRDAVLRGLDSIAFKLVALDATPPAPRASAALVPTLWDDTVLALSLADSARLSDPRRGWLRDRGQPVWAAVREPRGQPAVLLLVSDNSVGASGAPLAWRDQDTLPAAGNLSFRTFGASEVRPLANAAVVTAGGPGVRLEGWTRRVLLAWALQAPAAFSAPRGSRITWRLDPTMRLRAVAPFAYWTPPRARVTRAGLVWQSDGVLTAELFPSSSRVSWTTGKVAMVRSSFLGVVAAADGRVRIFRREPADSLAAAWSRITRPLVEPAEAAPLELRRDEAYPDAVLAAQTAALEGPAWSAGHVASLPPEDPGGERVVPFSRPGSTKIGSLLLARRGGGGDTLRLVRLDTLWTVDGAAALGDVWKRFPFRQALEEEVLAGGDSLRLGQVRFARVAEGLAAYQPAWAVSAANHARLVLVNVALGRSSGARQVALGTGRGFAEAWRNLRGETTPLAPGAGAEAVLEQTRRLVLRADSARKRGDLETLQRTLAELKELLELRRP